MENAPLQVCRSHIHDYKIATAVEPKDNLHTRRMTKSKLPMLDRKVSTLSYYNIIYQQRMREQCFTNISNGWIKQAEI